MADCSAQQGRAAHRTSRRAKLQPVHAWRAGQLVVSVQRSGRSLGGFPRPHRADESVGELDGNRNGRRAVAGLLLCARQALSPGGHRAQHERTLPMDQGNDGRADHSHGMRIRLPSSFLRRALHRSVWKECPLRLRKKLHSSATGVSAPTDPQCQRLPQADTGRACAADISAAGNRQ
ncbi:hypothetical protein FQZ97_1054080 [compost metagenome]